MFAGFDFGTSNCAIGIMNNHRNNQHVQLLPINQGQTFMPSVVYATNRELICESAALQMTEKALQQEYMSLRKNQLEQAQRVRIQEDIPTNETTVFIGQEAFDQYLSFPGEGYFVKSIKSFLGCSGLQPNAVHFFEDIVTAMMLNIKQRAESSLGKSINHTVIGRPVNFQGVYAEESNRRAIEILTVSAKRAGFKSIEFLYEPLAAGLDFETRLQNNKTVLVVDVGGGTTDCSMVRMGPANQGKTDREDDILGHSGERIGGNDLDIKLAGNIIMPLFGLNSKFKDGIEIPREIFWYAVRTNNVGEQAIFNGQQTAYKLKEYLVESGEPELLSRFIKLRDNKQNHQLVKIAEQAKISLSESEDLKIDLDKIEHDLNCSISREQFASAVKHPVLKMGRQIEEVIKQAGCQPELVYITGGAAKSHVIRNTIEQSVKGVEIIDGDHFGGVAKGLTVWAERLFG